MVAKPDGVGLEMLNPTGLSLSSEEMDVLRMMFASYQRVTIREEFRAGLSGSRVLLVRPIESEQSPELPAVVKIAPAGLIQKEARAYQDHVRRKLPGIAELMGEPVFLPDGSWGGLRYTLMGEGGTFEVESLRSYYRHASVEDLRYVLRERLFRIIGPNWWQMVQAVPDWPLQPSYDRLLPVNLLIEPAAIPPDVSPILLRPDAFFDQRVRRGDYVRLEGFVVSEVDPQQQAVTLNLPPRTDGLPASYRLRLQAVESAEVYRLGDEIAPIEGRVIETRAGQLHGIAQDVLGHAFDLTADTLTSAYGIVLPNPLTAAPTLLGRTRNVRMSCIHGDLNMENILVEPVGRNVSVIDFATVRRDHALHDLLRLETEVVTKLLPEVSAGTSLLVEEIEAFCKRLHEATFAQEHAASAQPSQADLDKPLQMLVTIREMARQCLFDANDWSEYYEGLVLYLLGALKFKNLDRLAKQIAFWIAAVVHNFVEPVAERVTTTAEWSRLRRYLTAEMYQEKDEGACLDHLNTLLRAVLTYVPRHVALDLLRKPVVAENRGQFLEGTLLFADISGFTAMSEELRERGAKEGAEEITRVINEYLDVMLTILFTYEGQLIKFGGDAMLCLFTGEDRGALNAVAAAWEMKRAMAERFSEIEVLQEIYALDMKAGGSSGLLFAATVGTAEHMEYIITGRAVERTAQAESAAPKGNVLVSHETYDLVRDALEAESLAQVPDFYRVIDVRSELAHKAGALWRGVEEFLSIIGQDPWRVADRLDALSPYLPAGVLPQLVYNPRGGQVEGQHRQVTVLFANFVGMSDIIHARGVDDVDGITADLGEYFQAMQEEIEYYGGVVNKVDLYDQGDKLMVMFGAPVAHEQDAQRAALTALAMQEAMSRLSSPTASTLLSQRIGIHTGFVFAGNVGSSTNNRREYTVMGDTVNLAARLMSAAPPGQVWVSQRIWDQIQRGFEAKELPPVKMKGISEPVPVYRLEAATQVQRDRDWSRLLRSDVVGRDRELQTLDACFDDLLVYRSKQIIGITGETGVGKSRLMQEWRRRAAAVVEEKDAPIWLGGRGHSYGQRTHGVFIEVLEQLLDIADDDAPAAQWDKLSARVRGTFADAEPGWFDEFSNRLAYLGQFLALDLAKKKGLSERVAQAEAETLQIQTRLAICDLLTHAAQERPLVLVLEDLHWADDASLDLLEFLVDRVSDATSVLFCLIFRPQKERPIWQVWHQIQRSHPDCHSISLRELGPAAGRELMFNLLQASQFPEDFQALILEETDGNPLYIEEVLHTLVEDGVLVQDEGEWQLTRSVEHIQVPDTLYQIIQSRIDELDFGSPGARRVLWMASVIGDEFGEELLLHMFTGTGRKEEEFLRHLRELRNAAMIERVGIGRDDLPPDDLPRRGYRFRHGLVQQVAYENMLVAKRCEYHCEVGSWWEERYSDDLQKHYDTLAHHYDRGRHWEKALRYHWLAGKKDAQAYANQDAALHLQRALEIAALAAPSTDMLAEVHFELGKVLAVTGAFDGALEHLEEAYDLLEDSRGLPAVSRRARVCYHIGRIYERKGGRENLRIALAWQGKGLALLPETPTAEAALLRVLGGIVGLRQADFGRADRECEQSLALAQATDSKMALALVHRLLSISLRAQGRLGSAMDHCERGIEVCEGLSDLIGLATSYANQGVLAMELDDWKLAQASYLQALEMQERIGDKYQLAMTCCNLGDLCCHLGDLEQGFAYAQRGLDLFAALESYQGEIFARAVLATVLWRQQRLEQAQAQLDQARQLVETHDEGEFRPQIGRWLAQVHLTAGNVAQAWSEIQALLSLDADMLDVETEPIQRLRGQVLAAQGKLTEAAQVLEASLERLEQKQARYETGRTLLALAGMLVQMEDRAAEAREHAERARAICADLGAKLDVQEADELLVKL